MKTHVHMKTCKWMFIAALFLGVKIWKQPWYPSMSEWFNKLQYIQTMEYHSAIKRSKLFTHTTTWMDLREIMLTEEIQTLEVKYSVMPSTEHSWNDKTVEGGQMSGSQRAGKGVGGGCGYKRATQGVPVMKVFCVWLWWSHKSTCDQTAQNTHTQLHTQMSTG